MARRSPAGECQRGPRSPPARCEPYRVAGVVAGREDGWAYWAARDRGFPGATTIEGETASFAEAQQIVHEHVTADEI